jgi:proteasome accessory factor A
MLEAEAVESGWLLEDPLAALKAWSRDPGLAACASTCDGRRLTVVELQRVYFERARHFVACGGCEGTVPHAEEILAHWDETLTLLERRDLPALARRLDWAIKLAVLERARAARPGMEWTHPALKHLDLLYGSLDHEEGIFFGFERQGLIERVVAEDRVRHFELEPPEDTRAWTRAMLLRRHGWEIHGVDWDEIRVRSDGAGAGFRPRRLELPDPAGAGRAVAGPCFERAQDLEGLLEDLEATLTSATIERRHDHA